MSLRLLAVGVEFSVGLLLLGWGMASAVRPTLWGRRGARWWVDRASRTISRVHGFGIALVGVAIAVSAPAPLLGTPAGLGGIVAHRLEVIGLVVVVLGAVLLAVSYPEPHEPLEPHERSEPQQYASEQGDHPTGLDPVPTPALASATS